MNRFLTLLFLLIPFMYLTCFISYAQQVKEDFTVPVFTEQFDTANHIWPIIANADNLFIVQDGEYVLHRKNQHSFYTIMPIQNDTLDVFSVQVRFRMEPSTITGSIGLLFLAQQDGNNGFVIEINSMKQYRVKQLVQGTYQYLTGEIKKFGWVVSDVIKKPGEYNKITVCVAHGSCDLYINDTYFFPFFEPAYKTGKNGIVIAPVTKAKIDYFIVNTSSGSVDKKNAIASDNRQIAKQTVQKKDTLTKTDSLPVLPKFDTLHKELDFTEVIIKLQKQVNILTKEAEQLRIKNDSLANVRKEKEGLVKEMKRLEEQAAMVNAATDSLKKIIVALQQYKDIVLGSGNEDIIISLSKSLQTEKYKNEELLKKNKELLINNWQMQDSIVILNDKIKQTQKNKTTAVKDSDKTKQIHQPDSILSKTQKTIDTKKATVKKKTASASKEEKKR